MLNMKRVKVNIGRHKKERWNLLLLFFRIDLNCFSELLEPYFQLAPLQLLLETAKCCREIPADGSSIDSSRSIIGSAVAVPIIPRSPHPQLTVSRL